MELPTFIVLAYNSLISLYVGRVISCHDKTSDGLVLTNATAGADGIIILHMLLTAIVGMIMALQLYADNPDNYYKALLFTAVVIYGLGVISGIVFIGGRTKIDGKLVFTGTRSGWNFFVSMFWAISLFTQFLLLLFLSDLLSN